MFKRTSLKKAAKHHDIAMAAEGRSPWVGWWSGCQPANNWAEPCHSCHCALISF